MITDGRYFNETLTALGLEGDERQDTQRNAVDILGAIIEAFGGTREAGIDPNRTPNDPRTGLVYGRIQSGKTRAMIASTALAFDNRFRIAVVLTSNINDLVSQTHIDFTGGLPGITTFTKDNDLQREADTTRLHLERGDGRLLLICSKGAGSLRNVAQFLRTIAADRYPAIIFDDEGDQASLDANTRRRSRARNVAVGPSPINDIIQNRLRPSVPRHVYVSVTGTPQAVLLQSADSNNRPSFIAMLPPGDSYVGGERFFDGDEPDDNRALIALVDRNEQQQLLSPQRPIPSGLRASILFFLVSAAAAIRNIGLPERGYSYLCHPSLKNDEQAIAERKINTFLTVAYRALLGAGDADNILRDLEAARLQLGATLGEATPTLDEISETLRQHLPAKRLLVINTRVRRQGINYGRGLNFLIGGNTLGRGIAIRDLLVTYYVREARMSQIDTMHQHARMYGYRSLTLPYTRLFIPRHLYYRFRDIHHSDEDLRGFIEQHRNELPTAFPVEVAFNLRNRPQPVGLRPTRASVLEVGKIDALQPGMHIYPNYIVIPQDQRVYGRVLARLSDLFGVPQASAEEVEAVAGTGREIDPNTAAELAGAIRTGSRNTWRDSTIAAVIRKVAESFDNRITLRFRTADRTVGQDRFISTGTLSGDELRNARGAATPTLWIMAARTTPNSAVGGGHVFMYPTFVIPARFPSVFIFNRGT
jgi:Z1 domain